MSPFPDNAQLINEVKDRVSLVEEISRVVRLKRAGREYTGCCPFHSEKTPSFTVNEDKGFYHCFGCGAHGDVISFVTEQHGMSFKEAVNYLAGVAGLQPLPDGTKLKKAKPPKRISEAQLRADKESKIKWARRYWKDSGPIEGTLGEAYLRSRGIDVPIPPSLRFTARMKHKESGKFYPAMVAGVQDVSGKVVGAHRTFLDPSGNGKAPEKSVKKMMGIVSGGAVRFAKPAARLGIGEGIESTLSVMQALPDLPCWAALSIGNMGNVILPDVVKEVVLLADSDMKDLEAGERQMRESARRLVEGGRKVSIAWPPKGKDFNDLLAD